MNCLRESVLGSLKWPFITALATDNEQQCKCLAFKELFTVLSHSPPPQICPSIYVLWLPWQSKELESLKAGILFFITRDTRLGSIVYSSNSLESLLDWQAIYLQWYWFIWSLLQYVIHCVNWDWRRNSTYVIHYLHYWEIQ